MVRGGRRGAPLGETRQRAEAFRLLRSSLEVSLADLERHTILITSASAGEGKTSTCADLATSMALGGRRVVVVDLDLRHPDVHNRFGAVNGRGVTDVLLDRAKLDDCLQFVELGEGLSKTAAGLFLLPTGSMVDNPAELLGTVRTARLLQALAAQADLVLVDGPPVLPVADSHVLARLVGGVVIVAESGRTTYPQLQRTRDILTRSQARILGIVVNKAAPDDSGYGYGYGYGYGVSPSEA